MKSKNPAIEWLLRSKDPSIRFFTLTDLLGESANSRRVKAAREEIPSSPRVRALLGGQKADGGFGMHPYQKWRGAHWRLVSVVELGIPPREPRALNAVQQVLRWLTSRAHQRDIRTLRGRVRCHASMEGNALGVCSRLGLARDDRVRRLADFLVNAQWDDGGWNCDPLPDARHSSFYESLTPLWGLTEYHNATGDPACRKAAERTAEFFLRHRLFRSEKSGEVINSEWLKLHYPLYWHYDVLHALKILMRAGRLGDPRADEALNIVEAKRTEDGIWEAESFYWWPRGRDKSNVEVVNWGRKGPNEMITMDVLRVLKAAGRLGSAASQPAADFP